jgi:predicted GNAT family acetyltransferase
MLYYNEWFYFLAESSLISLACESFVQLCYAMINRVFLCEEERNGGHR